MGKKQLQQENTPTLEMLLLIFWKQNKTGEGKLQHEIRFVENK